MNTPEFIIIRYLTIITPRRMISISKQLLLVIIFSSVFTFFSCESQELYDFAKSSGNSLSVTAGDMQLYLSWKPVEGAAAYEVWYNTTENSATALQSGVDITATSYTITGLTNGTVYYVWVKAKNAQGIIWFSNAVSGMPFSGGPVTYTVTFDSQGGSAVSAQTVPVSQMAAMPGAPALAGFAFEGWFKEPACTTLWNFSSDLVTDNITLYAKWLTYTAGLAFTLINGNTEYSVTKGTANTAGSVIIPGYWEGKKVTAVGDNAFQSSSGLTGVTIPASVTIIGAYAFNQCIVLSSLLLPSDLTVIGDSAFEGCTPLIISTLPGSLSSIGMYAFKNCSSINSITLPASVVSIGNNAFNSCTGLVSIVLPSGLTTIGSGVFQGCTSLSSISIPGNVTSIGTYAFDGCSLLSGLVIPANVTSIGSYSFRLCTALTSLTIPANVTSIDTNAFANSGLTSLSMQGMTAPTPGANTFLGVTGICTLHIHSGTTGYAVLPWTSFSSVLQDL